MAGYADAGHIICISTSASVVINIYIYKHVQLDKNLLNSVHIHIRRGHSAMHQAQKLTRVRTSFIWYYGAVVILQAEITHNLA